MKVVTDISAESLRKVTEFGSHNGMVDLELWLRWIFFPRYMLKLDDGAGESCQAPLRKCLSGEAAQVQLEIVSAKEIAMIRELMAVQDVRSLGVGFDVVQKGPHDGIEVITAWKVGDESPVLKDYIAAVEQKNLGKNKGHRYWTPTCHDALQRRLHDEKFLSDNEYLLLHGLKLESVSSVLSRGFRACQRFRGKLPTFGRGVYLADVIDKADQYCTSHLLEKQCRNWDFLRLIGLSEEAALVKIPEDTEVFYVLVVRAYLGRHLEVQKEGSMHPPNLRTHSKWHWRDPQGPGDEVVIDDYGQYDRTPPGEYDGWDSVKVMATEIDSAFSEKWRRVDIVKGKPSDNTNPRRFNEYTVPPQEGDSPEPPCAAVQYVVAYQRTSSSTRRDSACSS
jgi:hypothetical protein